MKTYDHKEAEPLLIALSGWNFIDNSLEKRFVFKNFKKALSFLIEVGILAEQANHHPEIFNVYNKVTLRLNTHEAKGVTDKDFALAAQIQGL